MKKTLLAAAVAAVCATPAMAADVQISGFIDQGLAYLNEDLNKGMGGPVGQLAGAAIVDKTTGLIGAEGQKHKFSQGTGNVSTVAFKASEAINDDVTVRVHLEMGYLHDSGEFYGGTSKPLFERESSIAIESKTYGAIKFGRMPALLTGSGTTGIFNSRVNPFGAGWGNMTGGWKFVGTLAAARHDNMINYISPKFGNVQIHAQYSMGKPDTNENTSETDRYAAIGATVIGNKYALIAGADWLNAQSANLGKKNSSDDAYKVLVGGNYDFDSFKLYGSVQYMHGISYVGGYSTKEWAPRKDAADEQNGFESWGIATGISTKVAGGTVRASVGYGFGENRNVEDKNEFERVNAGLGYQYALSKRTSVYGIAGYFWQDADWQKSDIQAHEVIVGLMHRF